jgi:hypothetical protein
MGSHTTERTGVDCGEDHGYSRCPSDHVVSATYHRSSEMVTLRRDSDEWVMPVALLDQLDACIQGMRANGGMD